VIFGAHLVLYSNDAEADRAFLRDILGLASVDAGHGWLIFALPPAEAAIHPTGADGSDSATNGSTDLYLMTTDLASEMLDLEAKGVRCAPVQEARWGTLTRISLPSGAELGLYQPRHPSPLVPVSE
jgi:catechol 2,3-dioxygenase-like lactoylglutathione lyase family enzyme